MQTDFVFAVNRTIYGSLPTANGVIHIVEIGSVASILPVGEDHIVFLGPAPALGEDSAYAILEGVHGRFTVQGDVVTQQCVNVTTHQPIQATGPTLTVEQFVSMVEQANQ